MTNHIAKKYCLIVPQRALNQLKTIIHFECYFVLCFLKRISFQRHLNDEIILCLEFWIYFLIFSLNCFDREQSYFKLLINFIFGIKIIDLFGLFKVSKWDVIKLYVTLKLGSMVVDVIRVAYFKNIVIELKPFLYLIVLIEWIKIYKIFTSNGIRLGIVWVLIVSRKCLILFRFAIHILLFSINILNFDK